MVSVSQSCSRSGFWRGTWSDYGQLQAADRLVEAAATGPLFQACYHVLGTDIEFHLVGSSSRQTVSPTNSDLDIHIRRLPGSERADEPFTETDKVAPQQVQGPVTVGDVAIKLVWRKIPVDLVLFRPRVEEFPNLRRGDNFLQNCQRIHEFIVKAPAAKMAIVGVKQIFRPGPKGILLEAIVWRIAQRLEHDGLPLTHVNIIYLVTDIESKAGKELQLESLFFFAMSCMN